MRQALKGDFSGRKSMLWKSEGVTEDEIVIWRKSELENAIICLDNIYLFIFSIDLIELRRYILIFLYAFCQCGH